MTVLSERVSQIKPSATMAVNARATELRAEGRNIINLSVGEPDFPTPDFICQAGITAINEGFTRYTAADGIPELKAAIINKLERDNQLSYEPNEIIVSCGAKQVLYNACQAILNKDDEVIIPAPYWVSYPAMTQLAGANPIVISTNLEQRFKITPEQLKAAITDKTRMLFFNSPSNPTGMAYSAEELAALGAVLAKHPNITIVTDDIYEYILWGMDKFISLLNVCPELKDRTLVVNGVSKAHAMTGWRIGYAAGPKEIIGSMKKIQGQSTSNPCSISQKAAVAALSADKDSFFPPMLTAYKERHDFVLGELQKLPGVECQASDGTFYLFPNVSTVIQHLGLDDDIALAGMLLDKAGVACVPGTAFGAPGCIRLSCATSMDNLQIAMRKIAEAIA